MTYGAGAGQVEHVRYPRARRLINWILAASGLYTALTDPPYQIEVYKPG